MLYATTLATFHQKLAAESYLQLTQIRLAYTPNIYHKQHLLREGSTFYRNHRTISPSVHEIKYGRLRSDYRRATATTENRITLQKLQGQSRQEQM